MSVLEVVNLSRSFGNLKAVDELSFSVEPGQICGFIGPNGAGKTTTMRIIATLDLPDSGDTFIDGLSGLVEPRAVRKRLGFMPDHWGTEPYTPVKDYLDFHARARGLKGAKRQKAIADVVEFTGLAGLMDKESKSLSKGMRQRAGLAVTLLHDPKLLILDEPASGLDPRARVELRELLRLLAGMGKAILISSHILTELSEICDTAVIIERGQLKASGPVDEIKKGLQPDNLLFIKTLEPAQQLERFLLEQQGVSGIRPERGGIVIALKGDDERLALLVEDLVKHKLRPVEVSPISYDLEEMFLSLTKGDLQ